MDKQIDLKELSKTIDTICQSDSDDESIDEEVKEEAPVVKEEVKEEAPVVKEEVEEEPHVGKPKKKRQYKTRKDRVVIQIIDPRSGNVVEQKTPSQIRPPTKKQLEKQAKQAEYDKQAKELEEKLGYEVARLKSGAPRVPKKRTEKQLANDKRLAEANRERHRLKREQRKQNDKQDLVSNLKEIALMKKDDIMKQVEKPKVEKPKPTVSSLLG